MTRWIYLFLTTIFLMFGKRSIGQITHNDTSYTLLTGEKVVQKGDSSFFYYKNHCLKQKGIWNYKIRKWVGKTCMYYEMPCGQVSQEYNYDERGRLISFK